MLHLINLPQIHALNNSREIIENTTFLQSIGYNTVYEAANSCISKVLTKNAAQIVCASQRLAPTCKKKIYLGQKQTYNLNLHIGGYNLWIHNTHWIPILNLHASCCILRRELRENACYLKRKVSVTSLCGT